MGVGGGGGGDRDRDRVIPYRSATWYSLRMCAIVDLEALQRGSMNYSGFSFFKASLRVGRVSDPAWRRKESWSDIRPFSMTFFHDLTV